MKKTIAVFLTLCLGVVLFCFPAAAANCVPEIEIDVALRADGSAAVTQVWTADTEDGTEFYLACRDSGYLRITDFSVSDEEGVYAFQEDWDVGASFEEKARKCGICETDNGVELCWGIGQYGSRRYTLTYVLHDLVGAYSDADGFNHRFVDEMSVFPTDVSLTIRREDGLPLTDSGCDIWAFGYDGGVWFEDGVIRAQSDTALQSGEHMTVMVSLAKGVLSPLRQERGSFEKVKERAFKGSDYEDEVTAGDLLLGVLLLVAAGLLIAIGFKLHRMWKTARLERQMNQADYFRDAPNDGNRNVTHRLGAACGLCTEESLLGAYLLRLISDGALEPEEHGKTVWLCLKRPPRSGDVFDEVFYTVLQEAAGEDGILQPKELEQYCGKNGKPLAAFVDSCRQDADRTLIRAGCYKGAVCEGEKSLTQQGRQQLNEILGLKRFLLDFSLIHERSVQETVIWQDYLIYAYLLGIADRVTPQLCQLYPDVLPQVERFGLCVGYMSYYDRMLYSAYEQEHQRAEAARSAGSGGAASFGGGGGFSGGGGGGVR